jgi:hypothetical protein
MPKTNCDFSPIFFTFLIYLTNVKRRYHFIFLDLNTVMFVVIFLCQRDSHSVLWNQQDAQLALRLLGLITSTCFEHLFDLHQDVLYIQ